MEKKYLTEMKIAEEFIRTAKDNLVSSLRTSANRVYFALEKAVISYFLFKNVKISKNHKKIWELSSEFLGERYYSLLRLLYDLRMQADYGSMSVIAPFNREIVEEKISEVECLINEIKEKIKRDKNKKEKMKWRNEI